MAQSLSRILVHVIFSTKHREAVLTPEIRPRLYAYLGTALRDNDCAPIKINGTADHIHLLFGMSRKIALAKVIERLKSASSRWMKDQHSQFEKFYWQAGYGAFSVSASKAGVVTKYIEKQEIHHRTLSFKEEFVEFLKKHGVDYDEEYLWD